MEYFRKRRFYLVLVLVLLSFIFSACVSPRSSGTAVDPVFTGETAVSSYIRTWALDPMFQKGSPYWDASMVKAEYLTDLIIAFALIDGGDKHTIYVQRRSSDLWDEVAALKSNYPHLKVSISVGGYGADHFSDMAHDPDLRAKFVAGVVDWLNRYDMDGVDIDWEYPVGPSWGQSIKSRSEDRRNYLSLLRDLREALNTLGAKTGKYYTVSTAVPSSSWFVSAINVLAVSDVVDTLKLMSYDYYGPWSSTTGHNANIFKNPKDKNGWSTDQGVNLYLRAGVPPHKIHMGVAFYGRAYAGVRPGSKKDGLFQSFSSIPFRQTQGYVTWSQIEEMLQPDSGFTRYWDDVAKAPYLYDGDVWVTYTDQQAIKELVDYSKKKGLGGFFSWEYGTDMYADLLKSLYENAQ